MIGIPSNAASIYLRCIPITYRGISWGWTFRRRMILLPSSHSYCTGINKKTLDACEGTNLLYYSLNSECSQRIFQVPFCRSPTNNETAMDSSVHFIWADWFGFFFVALKCRNHVVVHHWQTCFNLLLWRHSIMAWPVLEQSPSWSLFTVSLAPRFTGLCWPALSSLILCGQVWFIQ